MAGGGEPGGARKGPASALAVTRLSLSRFRSYEAALLALDTRPVVLVGPNGAGKTNVLEALSLLAPGRGLRGARMADLVHEPAGASTSPVSADTGFAEAPAALPERPGAQDWAVAVTLTTHGGESRLGTGTAGGDRRVVRVNGAAASGAGAFADHLRVAWLTPAMDRLFIEGPSERRRFLDRLVLGDSPDHAAHALAYERAMRTRNRLLSEGPNDPAWLSALEAQMGTHGAAMASARRRFVTRLQAAIDAWGREQDEAGHGIAGAFPHADISLEGSWEAAFDEAPLNEGGNDSGAVFADRLARSRPRDGAAGRTLDGPHRSDLGVVHRAKAMAARDCSTGEQKALLIGLILANVRLRAHEDGRPPLLLLDEVAAHLDAVRRAALFDELCRLGIQAWMTGTDAVLFEAFGDRVQMIGVQNSTFLLA